MKAKPDEEPYIKGKLLPIDRRKKKIDSYIWSALPSMQLAHRYEEVQTVILLEYGESQVGTYTNGTGAYVRTCAVTIIDYSRGVVLAARIFSGSAPPATTSSHTGAYGSNPRTEVVQYLKKLPRAG